MTHLMKLNRKPLTQAVLLALGTAAAATAARPAHSAEPVLDEVVVTATKRSENLQNVPLSVMVLDTSRLTDLEVRGFAAGLSLEAAAVSVEAGKETKDVDLAASDAALGAVNGDVSFVNASAQSTSVVLVVESTFNEVLARGEVPRGLRAAPVTGKYSFADVPAGDYVVLAAFENDELVRDPDQSIGGTAIQRISVQGATIDVPGFKITGALAVVAPGKDGPETVGADVSFEWDDDSSEDGYEVTVLDTFGNEVWKDTEVPRVTGSATVTLAYGGPGLSPGYYQFRAVSWREDKQSGRTYISATEDLKGVFIVTSP